MQPTERSIATMRGALRWLLAATACVLTGFAVADDAHPPYVPQPVAVPADAPYRLPDGSIRVVGDQDLAPVLQRLNALFVKHHPDVKFTMLLKAPPTGFDGVMAGVSLFGPVARDLWDTETEPFERLTGHRPLDVHIGRRGFVAAGQTLPPALYVNAANPVRGIDFAEFGRIFTTGGAPGDLRRWSQLGATGTWAPHAIHVYGTRDDGKYVTAMRTAYFGGRPVALAFEGLPTDADVLQAVAGDRWGMGLATAVPRAALSAGVRMLPLAVVGGTPSGASLADVRAGRYPLVPFLHFYLHSGAGEPADPVAREYLRLALSREGQQIVDSFQAAPHNFVSLTPNEAERELAKLR
jgi:phosphate transport system substrate-binding protein